MLWLNLIIELATVVIIYVPKNSKYQNNYKSYDKKVTGLFYVDTV